MNWMNKLNGWRDVACKAMAESKIVTQDLSLEHCLVEAGVFESKGELRRLVTQGGVSLVNLKDDNQASDFRFMSVAARVVEQERCTLEKIKQQDWDNKDWDGIRVGKRKFVFFGPILRVCVGGKVSPNIQVWFYH
jgi:tyrosyl-tRNA synthetase